MAFDNNDVESQTHDRTRLVACDDESPQRIEELIAQSREYRLQYWNNLALLHEGADFEQQTKFHIFQ